MAVNAKNDRHPVYISNQSLLVLILISLSANLLYPGEVFFHSKYLLIFTSILTSLIVFIREARANSISSLLRRTANAFVPLLFLTLSIFSSINSSRSQEVLWLFFSYTCLFLTLRLINIGAALLLISIIAITLLAFFIDLFSLYQYFFGFANLKQVTIRLTNIDESFRGALLTRIGSKRVFANFPLPNTLAGFLAMVLPLHLFLVYLAIQTDNVFLSDSSKFLNKLFQSRWALIFLLSQLGLSLLTLIMTQSFGGWLCSSGVAVSLGIFLLRHRKIPLRSVAPIVWVLFIVVAIWMAWITQQRGFHLWDLKALGNPIGLRWIDYKTAISIFRDFPLAGVGLGNYGSINPVYQSAPQNVTQYAHNTFLQLLSECGLLFLGLCFFLLLVAVRKLSNLLSDILHPHPVHGFLGICLLGSLLAWVVHNLIDIDFYFPSLGALGIFLLGLFLNLNKSRVADGIVNSHTRNQRSRILVGAFAAFVCILSFFIFKNYLAQTMYSLALDFAEAKDLRKAQYCIDRAVGLNERDPAMIIFQAKMKFLTSAQRGETGPALLIPLKVAYKKATLLDPFNAEYHYELSRVLVLIGEKESASLARSRAIELFPSEPKFRHETIPP
jgi:O-Antigen ligase